MSVQAQPVLIRIHVLVLAEWADVKLERRWWWIERTPFFAFFLPFCVRGFGVELFANWVVVLWVVVVVVVVPTPLPFSCVAVGDGRILFEGTATEVVAGRSLFAWGSGFSTGSAVELCLQLASPQVHPNGFVVVGINCMQTTETTANESHKRCSSVPWMMTVPFRERKACIRTAAALKHWRASAVRPWSDNHQPNVSSYHDPAHTSNYFFTYFSKVQVGQNTVWRHHLKKEGRTRNTWLREGALPEGIRRPNKPLCWRGPLIYESLKRTYTRRNRQSSVSDG